MNFSHPQPPPTIQLDRSDEDQFNHSNQIPQSSNMNQFSFDNYLMVDQGHPSSGPTHSFSQLNLGSNDPNLFFRSTPVSPKMSFINPVNPGGANNLGPPQQLPNFNNNANAPQSSFNPYFPPISQNQFNSLLPPSFSNQLRQEIFSAPVSPSALPESYFNFNPGSTAPNNLQYLVPVKEEDDLEPLPPPAQMVNNKMTNLPSEVFNPLLPSNSNIHTNMNVPMDSIPINSNGNETLEGLKINVLGIPQAGYRSRVETQIRLCLDLVNIKNQTVRKWSRLKLPIKYITGSRYRRQANMTPETTLLPPDSSTLTLLAQVVGASNRKMIDICNSCTEREIKRASRRVAKPKKDAKNKLAPESLPVTRETTPCSSPPHSSNKDNANTSTANENKTYTLSEAEKQSCRRILLFNCSEPLLDFSDGSVILPTRITCYCRHHNEKYGFYILYSLIDHNGNEVAKGTSPPIMITDDHKSTRIGGLYNNIPLPPVPKPPNHISPPVLVIGMDQRNLMRSVPSKRKETDAFNSFNVPVVKEIRRSMPNTPNNAAAGMPGSPPSNQFAVNPLSSMSNFANPQPSSPFIERVVPNRGSSYGGTQVVIIGANFYPGIQVLFGNHPAVPVNFISATCIECVVPAIQTPSPNSVVTVTFPQQQNSNPISALFQYEHDSAKGILESVFRTIKMGSPSFQPPNLNYIISSLYPSSPPFEIDVPSLDQQLYQMLIGIPSLPLKFNSIISSPYPSLLHYAVQMGLGQVFRYLLSQGVDPNWTDHLGQTPLHLATQLEQKEMCMLLIKAGARFNLKNMFDVTPLQTAGSLTEWLEMFINMENKQL